MNLIRKYFNKKQNKSALRPEQVAFLKKISNIIGFKPDNLMYYQASFIHRSKQKVDENGHTISYERLEFLGDAMLSLVIAEYLFIEVPHADEGYLTKMRSKIVSREHLNELGKDLQLLQFVESNIQANQVGDNIYGNVFEALIGAIYLDKGYRFTEKIILERIIRFHVDMEELENQDLNFKSKLINWAQRERKTIVFDAREDSQNDSQRLYYVTVLIDNESKGEGVGFSKKTAEQAAAENACALLFSEIDLP